MNDKYKKLYQYLAENGMTDLDVNSFYKEYSTNPGKVKKLHSYLSENGMTDLDVKSFEGEYFPVKKKEVSQSGGISSAISKMAQGQPLVSSDSDDGIYLNPDNNQNYKKLGQTWYKDVTGTGEYKEMKSGDVKARYDFLNKNAVRIADLNGNEVKPNYQVDTEVNKQYDITPERLKEEEVLRTKELSKKPTEEKPFTPAVADGRIFDVSNEQEKVDFDNAYFDYVKSGKQERDLEIAKKEKNLENVLNSVTTDLIGSNEDEVVSKLQEKLKDYDYLEVSPAGFGYDGIQIKNTITNDSKFINLDNWTTDRDSEESKILKGFLEVNIVNDEYIKKQKQVDALRDRIEAEKKTNPYNVIFLQKQLNELIPQLDKERAKKLDYMSKDQYRSAAAFDKYEIEKINNNITKTILKKEDIKKSITDLNEYDQQVKESYKKGLITEEEYNTNYLPKINEQRKEIDSQIKLLKDDYAQSVNEQSAIQEIAGNAFNVESKRGNVISGAAFSFVQGMEQATRILTEGKDSRGVDKGVLTSEFAPQSFSEEYLNSGDLSTFETIVNGLANSGGSALAGVMTGGPVGSTLGLYASSYTNFMDQMNGPEFADVSELEKILLAGSVGAVTSQLEKFGLTKMFSKSPINKKITNYIFSKSLKGLPSDATAEMIDAAIEKEIKGLVANKVLKITGAGVIEYSTEASQELTEIGAKELLNQVKDKEYFKNPKTFGEVFELANKAGMLGMIGGAGMQSITQATMTAKSQLNKYQVDNIQNTINNKEIKDLFVLNIKDRILSGEITKKQGEAELNSLRESEGILTQIPDDISSEDKYKSFKLINERNEIQKQVEGKDPALVAAQTERINEINEELKTISKNAVQIQTTSEVSVQPEARTSEEVVQGESTTEPKVVTEEGKKEITIDKPVIAKNSTIEVDRVKSLPIEAEDGATFNLDGAKYEGVGLVVPVDSMNTTTEELTPDMVANFVEERQEMIGDAGVVKAGIYKFPNSNQVSIDLSIVVPESSREQAIEFGRLADQESLFDLATFENVKTGGTGNNPMKFTPEQHREIAKALKEGRVPNVFSEQDNRTETDQTNLITQENFDEQRSKQTTAVGQKVVTAAKLVIKALPGVKIFVHQTTAEFEAGIGEKAGEGDRGAYINGEIHINMENGADLVTLYHEAIHHALEAKGMQSGAILDLAKGLKAIVSDKELKKYLEDFISNYDENGKAEEYLAELGGIMAEAKVELTTSKFLQFKALLGRLAKKLGISAFGKAMQSKDAADFINGLTKAIRTGEEVKTTESAINNTIRKQKVDKATAAGNKLFNKPLQEAEDIAKAYMKSIGKEFVKVEKINGLDEELSKEIAAAYEAMKNDPNDPKVKAAYEAMAKETLDQYDAITKNGYNVEINNEEPYSSSEEMIEDLRDNKRMKIFSTESGFGDEPITDEQRAENPLLKDSGRKDANGQTLLVNDVFRFVHDFFGHAELGNGFGPIGEENAWRVHSTMYSPEAKKAMTSETRGQNSWVNFSGVNEAVFKKRDRARELRKEGKIEEANKLVGEVYEEMKFAEQKIGLLPEFAIEKPSIKKQKISPENSSNYANLTEDGKGNFVFYHRGGDNYEVIKRSSGGTTATSREEAAAISKVGGVAMYYTRPTDAEPTVGGTSQYAVKVEEGKVYDFNSDPLNIIKEARERFNKEYPGQAFNPNVQFAYVTKIANEKGYDMTVGEWNGRTRAQSVIELKPSDVQVTKGNQVVKKFNESYSSNTDKGFQSIIPKDKQNKLDAVYAKIYKARNSEGRYDDLYRLQEEASKLTEDQITEMIVNSDLSQEIKDEYQVIISAPVESRRSVKKQKAKKVTVNEMAALKDQIRLEARAARQAKADLNTKRKMLAAAVSNMVKLGTVKAKQAAVLLKRISYLNLDNPVMVDRFANYAEKVFERADYQNVLTNAFTLRKSIRRLLKTDNQAQVVGMARAFAKIDPSMVEDIDTYIEMANTVKAAVKPTVQKGFDTVMKEAASIAKVSEYTERILAEQEEMQRKELLAQYNDVEGMSENMTLAEMKEFISSLEDPNSKSNPNKEAYTRAFLKNRMDNAVDIIKEIIKSGLNPMTGEEVGDGNKDIMSQVIKIDLDEMSIRDAIKIVEGLENFIENDITSGLEAAVKSYQGNLNAKSLVAKGKTARPLRLFVSKTVGKIYSEQLFSLPNLIEKMFGGVTNSIQIMKDMGLVDLVIGVNKANRQHNDIIDDYSKQAFYNSKGFMDAENVYERGMIGFLKRNLMGTPQQMKAEFNRRVRMIQESINKLVEEGDSKEKKMGEIYQKVYNKLGVGEGDLDVILSRASDSNLEAVDWWIDSWSKHYQDLSDVSLSVYNTELGSDFNYTTDKYKRLSSEDQVLDEGVVARNGAFAVEIDYTDKKKTGVLMESTRPNVLPNGRYVSLDFDTNNSKSLKAALVDINTAAPIRQVDGFINSKAFKKLIPESEDRKILTKRINTYIRRSKGKSIVPGDTLQYIEKFTNYITSLGVGKALAGLNQTLMQTTPVMINTIANAGRFDLAGPDFNAWLNKTGMPIANRGLESQTAIDSIDSRLEATGQRAQDVLKKIAEVNQMYLKYLLVKPDVWIARSSFKSYYLQNLKRRGISTDIDWNTHEMDQEAAEYAQIMVDRQQNISDPMLAGEFLASDNPYIKISRKVILPFASFILNQKARMYNDFLTLFRKTTSKEDRAIALRSLTGLAAELATYQALGYGIKLLYDKAAAWMLGEDDEEEKDKKFLGMDVTKRQYNATKLPVKNIFNDIISPLPLLDGITTMGLNKALASFEYMTEDEIKDAVIERNKVLEIKGKDPMTKKEEAEFIENIKKEATYQVFDKDFDRSYGMIGIAGSTYQEMAEVGKLAYTGEFIDEFEGRETKKKLLPADREKLDAAILPMMLYSTGLLPKDVGTISRKYIDRIKKKAVTEKQYERFDEVQKELGRDLESWEIDMIKGKREAINAIDELRFVENNGGLTESQGREYVKLMKQIGEPSVNDLRRIQKGEKVSQILK